MSRPLAGAGRRRLVAVATGVGVLLAASPGLAARPEEGGEAAALSLLEQAARASRTLAYTGTQYVSTWRPASTTSMLVDVRHEPGRGAEVSVAPTAVTADADEAVVLAATPLDERLLAVLGDGYVLEVRGDGRCTGRTAQVVEAHRAGRSGAGRVAGRFWVDAETGLLLRREVFDTEGRPLRSSAFLDLSLTGPVDGSSTVPVGDQPAADSRRAQEARVDDLRRSGWLVPDALPGGFVLFDARAAAHGRDDAEVLHLAYSDGLSTTSLYGQRGGLGTAPPAGFSARSVAGRSVWSSSDGPERVVWAGGERVWTLVSDAPSGTVDAQVAVLPHAEPPATGLRARLARGASRLGAMLNPFD